MPIAIKYLYSQQLADRLYVETGNRVTEQSFRFQASEISPAARENSLVALSVSRQLCLSDADFHEYTTKFTAASAEIENRPGVSGGGLICVAGTVENVPTREEALAEIAIQLRDGASVAPALRDLAAMREAKRAADLSASKQAETQRRAELRESQIQAVLAWPLSRWIAEDALSLRARLDCPSELPNSVDHLREQEPRLEARAAEAEARLNTYFDQRTEFVRVHGSPSQIERDAAGALPRAEYDALAQEVLFAPFAALPRYAMLTDSDVAHTGQCEGGCSYRASTYTDGGLTEAQFAARKAILAIINAPSWSADVRESTLTREHEAYCSSDSSADECSACTTRLGQRVTIEFAGASYSREFAL